MSSVTVREESRLGGQGLLSIHPAGREVVLAATLGAAAVEGAEAGLLGTTAETAAGTETSTFATAIAMTGVENASVTETGIATGAIRTGRDDRLPLDGSDHRHVISATENENENENETDPQARRPTGRAAILEMAVLPR